MSILEFRNVKKDYRLGETTVHALQGVNLAVKKGEFIEPHKTPDSCLVMKRHPAGLMQGYRM